MHFGYSEAKVGLNVEAVCGMVWIFSAIAHFHVCAR